MSRSRLSASLPRLYRELLPPVFQAEIPDETLATCSNCAMCGDRNTSRRKFSPKTKCCTYYPTLPNYLVGAIIQGKEVSPAGYERIKRAIQYRVGVYPTGLFPPRPYVKLYQAGTELGFGSSASLRCPYFEEDGGRCSIWAHREAVCSTFFCKTVAGAKGQEFWRATKEYVSHLQRSLTIKCLLEVGSTDTYDCVDRTLSQGYEKRPLSREDLDGYVSEGVYSRQWGDWVGREEEFYLQCFRSVEQLDPEAADHLLGAEGRLRVKQLERTLLAMSTLPPVLKVGVTRLNKSEDGSSYLVPLKEAETLLFVPCVVIDAFDGVAPTADIERRLLDHHGLSIGGTVASLYFSRLLVDAQAGPTSSEPFGGPPQTPGQGVLSGPHHQHL